MVRYFADGIGAMPEFELWNDGSDIPVFAWRRTPGRDASWSLDHLQDRLRIEGWLIPAYPMPDNLADVTVQRIVVRNGLSMELAATLLDDVQQAGRLPGPPERADPW